MNSSDDGGVRTHARRLVPKTSASGRSQELRPLGHIINVRDSDRVRTRIDLVRIDPATLTGVDFKSTALTTRPHYRSPIRKQDRCGSRTRDLQISSPSRWWCVAHHVIEQQLRRDSNPQPPDSKSDTLSIAPRSCVCVEEQGFEPWAFRMQSGRSATELHPQICIGRGRGTVLSLIHISSPRDVEEARMPSSA